MPNIYFFLILSTFRCALLAPVDYCAVLIVKRDDGDSRSLEMSVQCYKTIRRHMRDEQVHSCYNDNLKFHGLMMSNITLVTVHASHYPALRHHNNNNSIRNHRQCKAVRPPEDGRKHARNMLRINWLLINHLLHLVGCTFIYLYLPCSSSTSHSP
jgi:hypothetical protein